MNVLDDIQQFIQQMKGFLNEPIIVMYDKNTNTYRFMQKGKIVFSSLLNYLSLPINRRVMILSYTQCQEMLDVLSDIVTDSLVKKAGYLFSPQKYGFDVYTKGDDASGFYDGPKLVTKIRYYSVKNWFAVRFFLYFYSSDLRNFYQYVKYKRQWNVESR